MQDEQASPNDRDRISRLVWWTAGGVLCLSALLFAFRYVSYQLSLADPLPFADPRDALRQAGCTLEHYPEQERRHVERLPEGFRFNSNPPTSGPHDRTPAEWRVYARPQPELALIHNLEHGGIVVTHARDLPRATLRAIHEWRNEDPTAVIVAPSMMRNSRVVLRAWTHAARCPTFDREAFDSFRDAYRYRGPEREPKDEMLDD